MRRNWLCSLRNRLTAFAVSLAFASVEVEAAYTPLFEKYEAYIMPCNHPLKRRLDKLFASMRVLDSLESLTKAGFLAAKPQPRTRLIVTTHPAMAGYIFKLYTDDELFYYRNEPEERTWMLRARGAALLRKEIAKQKWEPYFTVPKKWIYFLPSDSPSPFIGRLDRRSILVEDKMDLLPPAEIKACWMNGSVSVEQLDKLAYLIKKLGFRGGCKWDNVPICRDGRIAFIDTQNYLSWPLPYERLFHVLRGDLAERWRSHFANQ